MDAEHRFPSIEATLKKAVAALREAEVPFLLAGSLAVWARGGPETRHDLDFVVKEEDVERAVEVLEEAGMRPEKPPEEWLWKAWDGDVLIDLIFAPRGLEVTDEVIGRGEQLHVLDFTGLIRIARAVREQIDWRYLRERTKDSPYAAGFFVMSEELGIASEAHGSYGAEVRLLTPPAAG